MLDSWTNEWEEWTEDSSTNRPKEYKELTILDSWTNEWEEWTEDSWTNGPTILDSWTNEWEEWTEDSWTKMDQRNGKNRQYWIAEQMNGKNELNKWTNGENGHY